MMMDYIRKAEYAPASFLRLARVMRETRCIVLDTQMPWTELPLRRDRNAALEVQESVKDGVPVFSTKMEMALTRQVYLPEGPLAFRLTLLDGSAVVVGGASRPLPFCMVRRVLPERFSEAPVWILQVSWNATVPPLCVF